MKDNNKNKDLVYFEWSIVEDNKDKKPEKRNNKAGKRSQNLVKR